MLQKEIISLWKIELWSRIPFLEAQVLTVYFALTISPVAGNKQNPVFLTKLAQSIENTFPKVPCLNKLTEH